MNDEVKHKIKKGVLIAIVAILSISYMLIYGLNPLNHNHQLLYVSMGIFIVLQFKTGLRSCPALLCEPEISSDLKRLTQWLILILLMPVIKPISLELRPSAFNRMTWQRVRKQWLSPFFRPSSNAWCSISKRCGVFTRSMAAKMRNNIR